MLLEDLNYFSSLLVQHPYKLGVSLPIKYCFVIVFYFLNFFFNSFIGELVGTLVLANKLKDTQICFLFLSHELIFLGLLFISHSTDNLMLTSLKTFELDLIKYLYSTLI